MSLSNPWVTFWLVLVIGIAASSPLQARTRPRQDGRDAQRALQADPNNTAARTRYAQALSEQGACRLTLDQLAILRRSEDGWSSRMATLEGTCWLRLGDLSQAEAALEEALFLDSENAIAYLRLSEVALERGDRTPLDAHRDILKTLPQSDRVLWMLDLEESLFTDIGDLQIEALLFSDEASSRGAIRAAKVGQIYSGRGWLRDNEPGAAVELLGEVLTQNLNLWVASVYRIEAYRRAGMPDKAQEILDRTLVQRVDWALKAAYEVRVMVDQDRIADAEAALARLEMSELVEVVASRWYLAQARGDDAAARYHAAQWHARVLSSTRSLEQLLPASSGETP